MHISLLMNSEMASRGRFKINGSSLTNFSQTLKKRDELLLMRHTTLLEQLRTLREDLGLTVGFTSPSQTVTPAMNDLRELANDS